MANHQSARKRARQSEKRQLRNKINKTKVKNAFKAARACIGGDEAQGAEALKMAMSAIDKASSKGSLHRRTASRRISRLARQLAAGRVQA